MDEYLSAKMMQPSSKVALRKAQICMISFQTSTQIFGIHKALIHVKR